MYCTVITINIGFMHSRIVSENHMSLEDAINYKENTEKKPNTAVMIAVFFNNGDIAYVR